ncbi:MAG: tRNA (5-methylaminomethyl-2-thiouridylate)-methyltransferase [Gammaproteobacteria bacterium]|nr:tRNA (5-methylaminomethyl-2-thiouridylate)-methyltransferase [Gammaproteobacteria bacterium]
MDSGTRPQVQRKAVVLLSGGLDSLLAARMMLDQGIHVEGLNFFTGFCVEGHTHAVRKDRQRRAVRNSALHAAEQLGIRLHIIDVIDAYKDVVLNPRHGYGAHLNPCIDCKAFMVGKAREWMEAHGFDFIVTGEVLGQRPKSQRRDTFPIIARESGAFDRLLRPLSARLLAPTLPEREGWVDRERLLNLSGRNRKPQIGMAQAGGLAYAQPAGGCCFLTDPNYARKLRDLWSTRGERRYDFDDIMLLKIGRHIRPRPHFKLIIGREEGENHFLEGYRHRFVHLFAADANGPLALVQGEAHGEDLTLAAALTARFCQQRNAGSVRMTIVRPGGFAEQRIVTPWPVDQLPREWYL